jgi:multidrug efflux pump subunit AcrB
VQKRLDDLARAHPEVTFSVIDDSVHLSQGGFDSAMRSLLEGALLAVLVVFLFLRDWRSTLVAATALPLSVIPAFLAISLMGFSFNFVSLLAITLVTGVLVDDAIVEIENIVRHMRMGKSARQAAIDATDEIGLAVIAITLTITAIFAPVSFMGGIAGQYFKQFGLTIGAAVLSSLLVARLLTPVMAASLLRPATSGHEAEGQLLRAYLRLLQATLARPYLTLGVGMVLFVLSLGSTMLLPTDFIPAGDGGRSVLSLELPPGSTLEDTRVRTDRVAHLLRKIPEVTGIYVVGGATPTGDANDVRRATMVVTLTPRATRARSQKQVEADMTRRLATVPDLRGWYVNERGGRQLSVGLLSREQTPLYGAASRLESAMRRLPGFSNVAASAGLERPEIAIVPLPDQAARLGVTPQAIADAVRIATLGDIDANLPKFSTGDRQIPIRVEMARSLRRDLAALETLTVQGNGGIAVPLTSVATLRPSEGPSAIDRYDRERHVELAADLAPGVPLGAAVASVFALPEARTLPAGVRLQNGGDAEIMGEVFAGFATAMGTGLLIVLAVLVLLFGGVFQPITILLSLPFSLGGVILALQLTHRPISMPVVIGLLMLIGIVAKNAIMLVDFAVEAREAGLPRRAALVEAGRKRARPIVMTSIAMIAGMLPSAFGLGDGGEFRSPMAIGVIGGLTVSTVLSLVFVPAFYLVMDDLETGLGRLLRRRGAALDERGRTGVVAKSAGELAP